MGSGRKVLPWTDTNPQREQERFILAYLEGARASAVCAGASASAERRGTSGCTVMRRRGLRVWETGAEHHTLTPTK